jgi:hypothetical protein
MVAATLEGVLHVTATASSLFGVVTSHRFQQSLALVTYCFFRGTLRVFPFEETMGNQATYTRKDASVSVEILWAIVSDRWVLRSEILPPNIALHGKISNDHVTSLAVVPIGFEQQNRVRLA